MAFSLAKRSQHKVTKGRRYPIIRYEDGKTMRQVCFELFDQGLSAGEVWSTEDLNPATVRTYHAQWKKGEHRTAARARLMKQMMSGDKAFAAKVISGLAKGTGLSEEEVTWRLQQPYGMLPLLRMEWREHPKRREQEKRAQWLETAMAIARLVDRVGDDPERCRLAVLKIYRELRVEPAPKIEDGGHG